MSENTKIAETIKFLEKGNFHDRKSLLKDFYGKGAEINGYIIQHETWCWLIWKPTNIGEKPQYKGEPLVKVVPRTISFDKIADVLAAQPWTYI